jgi:hypothetical protein
MQGDDKDAANDEAPFAVSSNLERLRHSRHVIIPATRNWLLLSKDGCKSIELTLTGVDSLAADDDGICPITLERIDQSTLDFAPEGTSFFEAEPSLCVAVLPCRHRFHAIAVLFHMAVSSMNCPLCRSVVPPVCIVFFADHEYSSGLDEPFIEAR